MVRIGVWGILLCLVFSAWSVENQGLSAVADECRRIAKKLSSVGYKECLNRNLQLSGSESVKGTSILVKNYLPVKGRSPRGRILLVGGIHGDEYSSVSVTFKWLKILDKHHTGLFNWRISPLMNPDGLLQRRSSRVNANGVDLNRNFPTKGWKEKSKYYWEITTGKNARRFPGLNPLSEPESAWLYDEINAFKPDVIVAVHAPYGVLDFNHSGGDNRHPPSKLGNLYLNLLGTYPGSLGNFAGIQRQIPVLTIELKHAGIMPSPVEINAIWADMVGWLKKNLPAEGHLIQRDIDLKAEMSAALGVRRSK